MHPADDANRPQLADKQHSWALPGAIRHGFTDYSTALAKFWAWQAQKGDDGEGNLKVVRKILTIKELVTLWFEQCVK